MYIPRYIEESIQKAVKNFPVTALLGPRQCGKSTLARHMINDHNSIYLDLERPSDLSKLTDPEWFLESQKGKLICIDEIQRKPELFPLIRSLTDDWNVNGSFLILGSASFELIRQSSETLAGRISFKRLTPFLADEIGHGYILEDYILRGGYPKSYLAGDQEISYEWRENFITAFLERDLLQLSGFSLNTMRRLWTMLAYINGQVVNYSTLGNSLNVSSQTIRNYIQLLEGAFVIEVIPPFFSNLGKRVIKSPKIYVPDSGLITALLGIKYFDSLAAHPVFGSVWESVVLANLRGLFPSAKICFYRTSNGAECDFLLEYEGRTIAIECKAGKAPTLSKGNFLAFDDIKPSKILIVAPVNESWSMRKDIKVIPLNELAKEIDA